MRSRVWRKIQFSLFFLILGRGAVPSLYTPALFFWSSSMLLAGLTPRHSKERADTRHEGGRPLAVQKEGGEKAVVVFVIFRDLDGSAADFCSFPLSRAFKIEAATKDHHRLLGIIFKYVRIQVFIEANRI